MNTTTFINDGASEGGVISINEIGDGSASKADSFVHSPDCPDRVKTAYVAVADAADRDTAWAEKARAATLGANSNALAARDAAAVLEQRASDPQEGITADQLAAAQRAKTKARARADEASAEAAHAFGARDGAHQLFEACGKVIMSYRPRALDGGSGGLLASDRSGNFPVKTTRWSSKEMELAREPKLPSVDKLDSFIAEKRQELTRLRAQRSGTVSAPLPAEMVKRSLAAKVSALASAGELGVAIPSETRKAGLVWPMKSIGAEPPRSNPAAIPHAIDVEAVLCNLFGDIILERAMAAVDDAYVGTEVMLDPHDKKRALAKLDAAILETERAECAAILKLIEAGDRSVSFRPDTNPKAVLGLA
jgi:hypothetical protein